MSLKNTINHQTKIQLSRNVVYIAIISIVFNIFIISTQFFPYFLENILTTTISTNISTQNLTASTGITTPSVDTSTATTLNLGTTNANALSLSKTGASTTINGALAVTQGTTLNGATISNSSFSVANAPVSITPNQTIASAAGATWNGLTLPGSTATITGSTNITTSTGFNLVNISPPTLTASNALTVNNAATLYIGNAPSGAGAGPATITNPYGLWVDGGRSRFDGLVNFDTQTTVIAASDAITVTKSYHTVDTEAGLNSDDIATINGGKEGDILVIKPIADTRTLIARNAAGNLKLDSDFTMDDVQDTLTLMFDGTNWNELSRSSNQGNLTVRVNNSASINTNHATTTTLTFNSERIDTANFHSTVTNTSRLTAVVPGKYMIIGNIQFAQGGSGYRQVSITLNAGGTIIANVIATPLSGGVTTDMHISTIYDLAANDFVELKTYQNSGGGMNVVKSDNYSPEFMMTKIGD